MNGKRRYLSYALAASATEGAEARFRLARKEILKACGRERGNSWLLILSAECLGVGTYREFVAVVPDSKEGAKLLQDWAKAVEGSAHISRREKGLPLG